MHTMLNSLQLAPPDIDRKSRLPSLPQLAQGDDFPGFKFTAGLQCFPAGLHATNGFKNEK